VRLLVSMGQLPTLFNKHGGVAPVQLLGDQGPRSPRQEDRECLNACAVIGGWVSLRISGTV
jgi:hypothetical protein